MSESERARFEDPIQLFPWEEMERDYRNGRHPHPAVLRNALSYVLPGWVADYIVDRLEGKVRLPRGRQRYSQAGLSNNGPALLDRDYLAARVWRLKAYYQSPRYHREAGRQHRKLYGARSEPPHVDAFEKALAQVAQESRLSESTIRRWCYPPP